MKKEVFLYEYLIKYNEYESKIDGNVTEYWKSQNNDGLFFYALRNLLCHHTKESIENIKSYIPYVTILNKLSNLTLERNERLKLLEFMLNTSNIESEFYKRGFSKHIRPSENNTYMFYSRKKNELIYNIFFHNRAQFISCSISTYDFEIDDKILLDEKYYFETEPNDDNIFIKVWNYEKDVILKPYLNFEVCYVGKELYRDFRNISYEVIKDGKWKTHRESNENNEFLEKDNLKKLISKHFDIYFIEKIVTEAKKQYSEVNGILHKIGLNSDIKSNLTCQL